MKPWLLVGLLTLSARGYSVDQLADAIYRAEGGSKTRHPYGVLKPTSNPRLACKQTIIHAMVDFCVTPEPDFIRFLGSRYCPPNIDPIGHRRWVHNVRALVRSTQPPKIQ